MFRPNPNFQAEIEREAGYRQGLMNAARPAAEEGNSLGRRIMPKDSGPTFTVEADADGVRIVNHTSGWHIAEYGTIHTPAYAVWRTALRSAGLRQEGL